MKKAGLFLLSFVITLSICAQSEWKQIVIDNSLKLSAPFDMKTIVLDIDEETKQKVDKYISSSGSNTSETFVVAAVSAIYKPTITTNVNGALKGTVGSFKSSEEVNVVYDQKSLNDFGIQGTCATGYTENTITGKKSYFYTYHYGKNNKYWNIIILHTTNTQESRDMAQKVYQSIQITD